MPTPRHSVAVAILLRDHRVLLVHRSPTRRWYPDCWDLPGGHVEPGETTLAALARECREELGIDVSQAGPSDLAYGDREVETHAFTVTAWDGEPANREPTEHDDLRWFAADELPGLVLADDLLLPQLTALLR